MVFEPETLAPGPGIGVQAMATFRRRSFQSALSGSWVFHASTSGGGHDTMPFPPHPALSRERLCRNPPVALRQAQGERLSG